MGAGRRTRREARRQRVNIFEKMSPAEICKINKPSEKFAEILEETERRKGEPYEQQEAEGRHPQHEEELREQVHHFREASGVKSPGSTSKVKKKLDTR